MIAKKRELLLEAALACFVEQGFHATSTAEVATRAMVGNATLFRVFATKEVLMEDTCTYAVAKLTSLLTDRERAASPEERLQDVLWRWWHNVVTAALMYPYEFRYWCLYRATPRPGMDAARSFELGPFANVPVIVEQALKQVPWLTTNALPVQMMSPLLAGQCMAVVEILFASAAGQADAALKADVLHRGYTNWWAMTGLPSHMLVMGPR